MRVSEALEEIEGLKTLMTQKGRETVSRIAGPMTSYYTNRGEELEKYSVLYISCFTKGQEGCKVFLSSGLCSSLSNPSRSGSRLRQKQKIKTVPHS